MALTLAVSHKPKQFRSERHSRICTALSLTKHYTPISSLILIVISFILISFDSLDLTTDLAAWGDGRMHIGISETLANELDDLGEFRRRTAGCAARDALRGGTDNILFGQ